ncbi:hypothetical protein L9F63_017133 [Diploptera punctata]|uniref:Fe2OG dioxygenase domain-containing protein n=1 Tax=Diploptera punctata TaxID=6984 RepID=A0AAD7ZZG4_DIPPU|nr:hypothetical protein L9F63_017133 [Diploptera punctata]
MFKSDFKYYKRKSPAPDLSLIVDFKNVSSESDTDVLKIIALNKDKENKFGLRPCHEWQVHHVPKRKGLLFIPNPFTRMGQQYWIKRCVRDFTRKPNRINLDAHGDLREDEDWWDICSRLKGTERCRTLLHKLRWATLGYHHNWDTKEYSEDLQSPFPEDLAQLCQFVSKTIGLGDFTAEAAIVNFYHMDSTLSGHTDHSEPDKEAPLFSFSFGQSAIFLLGGQTLEEKPTAMLIRSGDIVVMTAESRLCYHGVPRILPADETPWTGNNDKDWEPFESYMESSRINMNVRQVLPAGYKHL